jgi:hypothetical protein
VHALRQNTCTDCIGMLAPIIQRFGWATSNQFHLDTLGQAAEKRPRCDLLLTKEELKRVTAVKIVGISSIPPPMS